MSDPPGMNAIMLDGHSADGRTNQARNEINPAQGDPRSEDGDGLSARPNAVSQTTPTMR
jgi:hypothetical protein